MKTEAVQSVVYYFVLLIIILITVFPFVFMLLASFKTTVEIQDPTKFLKFNFITTNYVEVFQRYDFSKPLWNSFFTASVTTILSLFIGLPAAYAIAHYRLHKISGGILITRMIPGICFLLPWFKTFSALHLTDTYISLILAYMFVAVPFIIWLMVPHFENLPQELFEAAMIDGCSENKIFFKILLPLVRPGIITAALMSFIYSWNNFLFALVLSGYETKTLPMAVYNFIGYAKISWGPLMAAATMITGPIVLISLIMQKYVVSGMTAGAVKG
jgi:multiple sugar transport system permease protein